MGSDSSVIPILFFINQNLFPRRSFPSVKSIAVVVSAAMVVIFYTTVAVNFGNISAVTECVGGEVYFKTVRVKIPSFLEIVFRVFYVG